MLETSYYPGFRRRTVPSCTPADQRSTSNARLSFRGILVIILPDDDQDPLLSVSPSVKIARPFATQPETRIRDPPALFFFLLCFPFSTPTSTSTSTSSPSSSSSSSSFFSRFVLYLLPNRIHGANALMIIFLAVTGIP